MSEPAAPWLREQPPAQAPAATAPAPPPQLGREPGDEPHPFGEDRKPLLKRIGGGIVALGAVLAKVAGSLKGVLLFLPKLKLLTTAGSMLVSVAAYSLIWGWTFALGFVILLLVHELGHVIQLRREGVKASAPVFIPFMGALIWAKSLGNDAAAEARTGLAGPVLGSIGAALCIPIWQLTGDDFWRALAFTGFFLNLFNLVPIVPLDGGRAMAALSPWMWLVGLFILAGLAFAFPNPILLLILLLAIFSTYSRYKQLKTGGPEVQAYYAVSSRQRVLIGAVYALLIVGLAIGMHETHLVRTFADA